MGIVLWTTACSRDDLAVDCCARKKVVGYEDVMGLLVRDAREDDLDDVSKLAARLVRLHHAFDPQRFFLQEPVEEGYRWWLGRELSNESAIVLVATLDERVAGYLYATIESRDWNLLLDKHAGLHDIYVDDALRAKGVGEALMRAAIERFEDRGVPRVVLMSATKNEAAQRLFARVGFRPTMVEMTRELTDKKKKTAGSRRRPLRK
jgi:ribosomal protein S18 acetylase RimI-like enzyme